MTAVLHHVVDHNGNRFGPWPYDEAVAELRSRAASHMRRVAPKARIVIHVQNPLRGLSPGVLEALAREPRGFA